MEDDGRNDEQASSQVSTAVDACYIYSVFVCGRECVYILISIVFIEDFCAHLDYTTLFHINKICTHLIYIIVVVTVRRNRTESDTPVLCGTGHRSHDFSLGGCVLVPAGYSVARCFPHVQCECAAEQGGAGQHGVCGDRGGTGRAGTAICRVGAIKMVVALLL